MLKEKSKILEKIKNLPRFECYPNLASFIKKIVIKREEFNKFKALGDDKTLEDFIKMKWNQFKNPPELLLSLNIHNRKDLHRWLLNGGHPDHGGNTEICQSVLSAAKIFK